MRPSPDSSIPPTSRAWSLPPHCPPPPSDGRIYILLPRTVSRTHLVYCPHHIAAPKAYRTVSPSKQPSRICARRQIEVVRTYIPNIKWNGTPLHGLADNPRGDSRTRTQHARPLSARYTVTVYTVLGARVCSNTHTAWLHAPLKDVVGSIALLYYVVVLLGLPLHTVAVYAPVPRGQDGKNPPRPCV